MRRKAVIKLTWWCDKQECLQGVVILNMCVCCVHPLIDAGVPIVVAGENKWGTSIYSAAEIWQFSSETFERIVRIWVSSSDLVFMSPNCFALCNRCLFEMFLLVFPVSFVSLLCYLTGGWWQINFLQWIFPVNRRYWIVHFSGNPSLTQNPSLCSNKAPCTVRPWQLPTTRRTGCRCLPRVSGSETTL